MGPKNPYAMVELYLRRPIDWSQEEDGRQKIAKTLNMKEEELYNPEVENSPIFSYRHNDLYYVPPGPGVLAIAPDEKWVSCPSCFVQKNGAEVNDPVQGAISNCGLISSFSSLAWAYPDNIQATSDGKKPASMSIHLFKPDTNDIDLNITDFILIKESPITNAHVPIGARSSATNVCWPALLEKACSMIRYVKNETGTINKKIDDPYHSNHDLKKIPFYEEPYCPDNLAWYDPFEALQILTGKYVCVTLLDKRAVEQKPYYNKGKFSPEGGMPNQFIKLFKKLCMINEKIGSILDQASFIQDKNDGPWEKRVFSGVTRDPVVAMTYDYPSEKEPYVVDKPPMRDVHYKGNNLVANHCYSVLGFCLTEYKVDVPIPRSTPGSAEVVKDNCGYRYQMDVIVRNPWGKTVVKKESSPGLAFYHVENKQFSKIKPKVSILPDGFFGIDVVWFSKYFKEIYYLKQPKEIEPEPGEVDPSQFHFDEWKLV